MSRSVCVAVYRVFGNEPSELLDTVLVGEFVSDRDTAERLVQSVGALVDLHAQHHVDRRGRCPVCCKAGPLNSTWQVREWPGMGASPQRRIVPGPSCWPRGPVQARRTRDGGGVSRTWWRPNPTTTWSACRRQCVQPTLLRWSLPTSGRRQRRRSCANCSLTWVLRRTPHGLVATLDGDGRPVVRLPLEEGQRELLLRIAGASAIESRSTDAA